MASVAEQVVMDFEDKTPQEELDAQKLSEAGEVVKETPSPEDLAAQEAATKKPDAKVEDDRSLRALAREQKRELDRQNIELERMRRQIEKAGLVDEEDKKADKLEQDKLKADHDARVSTLTNILETMKVNPKFEDVETVVSQDNFDDLVEAMAKAHVSENGGSLREAEQNIAKWIWNLPNPYQYAYDRIKTYHPAFRKAAPPAAKADKAEAEKKGGKKPVDVAPSINAAAGASSGAGGWTAAMIAELDEEDLPTVPKDVYTKYLLGDLK